MFIYQAINATAVFVIPGKLKLQIQDYSHNVIIDINF